MSLVSTTTTTTTDLGRNLRQALRGADPVAIEPERITSELNAPVEDVEDDDAFLPANHGVTGHEPNTNPPDWLTNHRHMPPHRPPVAHPEWVTVGGTLPMRIFLWNMFSGCQLLQVCVLREAKLPILSSIFEIADFP